MKSTLQPRHPDPGRTGPYWPGIPKTTRSGMPEDRAAYHRTEEWLSRGARFARPWKTLAGLGDLGAQARVHEALAETWRSQPSGRNGDRRLCEQTQQWDAEHTVSRFKRTEPLTAQADRYRTSNTSQWDQSCSYPQLGGDEINMLGELEVGLDDFSNFWGTGMPFSFTMAKPVDRYSNDELNGWKNTFLYPQFGGRGIPMPAPSYQAGDPCQFSNRRDDAQQTYSWVPGAEGEYFVAPKPQQSNEHV
ncbi:hypothetical protein FB451DRAFT_1250868 [Mycena latifolia]|nr:hypothetical protein FB451DRAFT_1250868 [Mycena latifolia]